MHVDTKRVYDEPATDDGYRVLVDRLWPRGVSKQDAHVDVWLKDIAPSTELRKWFNHESDKFAEFTARYQRELDNNPAVNELKTVLDDHPKVTLLYSAHDANNNVAVLLEYLKNTSDK